MQAPREASGGAAQGLGFEALAAVLAAVAPSHAVLLQAPAARRNLPPEPFWLARRAAPAGLPLPPPVILQLPAIAAPAPGADAGACAHTSGCADSPWFTPCLALGVWDTCRGCQGVLPCQQALMGARRAASLWRLEYHRRFIKVPKGERSAPGSVKWLMKCHILALQRLAASLPRGALRVPGGRAGSAARRASAVEARALAWMAWARRCLQSAPAGAAAGAGAPDAAGGLSTPCASGGWDAEGQAAAAAALAAQAPLVARLDDVAVQACPTGACRGAGTPCSAPLVCRP